MNNVLMLLNTFNAIWTLSLYQDCGLNWLRECSYVLELLEEHAKLMSEKKTRDCLNDIWKKAFISCLYIKNIVTFVDN